MKNISKVIATALQEVGYSEYPANSNKTKYGKWANFDGVAWCGIFVSWCFWKAGIPLPKIGFLFPGFAGCQTFYSYVKKDNWIIPFENASPGDIVLFDWNGDGRYDHVGLFGGKMGANTFWTVEGNTSAGNQSNGGQVQKRVRNRNVAIFVKPKLSVK